MYGRGGVVIWTKKLNETNVEVDSSERQVHYGKTVKLVALEFHSWQLTRDAPSKLSHDRNLGLII